VADWLKIKTEYISTDISYRKIAEKYGVSFNTLQDMAKREGWKQLRDKQHDSIATVARQKAIEAISDNAANYAASVALLSGKAVKLVEKSMDNAKERADPYKVKALVSAIKDLADLAEKITGGKTSDAEDLTPLADLLGEQHE